MDGIARMLRSVTTLGILTGALLAGSGAHAQTRPPEPAVPPFAPITIARLGPVTTNQPNVAWIGITGDWAIYAQAQPGCGHCQPAIDAVYVQNLSTMRRVVIHFAVAQPSTSSLSNIGASGLLLNAGKLYWTQPDVRTPPAEGFRIKAGDYSCAQCFYNIFNAAEAGPGTPPPPRGDMSIPTVTVERGPAPTYQPQTLVVTDTSMRSNPLRLPLTNERSTGLAATDGNHVIYSTLVGGDGSDYGSNQLIRVAAIMPAPEAFDKVWGKADAAVKAGTVARPWLWGPQARYIGNETANAKSRPVVYYDKSRMEINDPYNGNPADPYYVTNGLLVAEMIGGEMQISDTQVVSASVACTLPVVGDARKQNPLSPSYADLARVASLHGDHQAADRRGQPVDGALDAHGIVSTDAAHAGLARYAAFAPQTGHNIPDRFWTYLQGMHDNYGFDWTYVVGYPITEGYWTQMRVGGKDYPVLIQAFQRRVLTFVPDFAPAWQIQQGNVGQHYLEWRYALNGLNLPAADGYMP